ncbi:MAG: SDR family NAD(P)-dependent oxidoreductase [Micromonosporaceae bacterium]
MSAPSRPVAVITGASAGLGLATAHALAARRWTLIIDARGEPALRRAAAELGESTEVTAIAGDVSDPEHRQQLADALPSGRLDLLVNNASLLGPSPQPALAEYPLTTLQQVYEVNVFAPLALTQLLLPKLGDAAGIVINISSDAAIEPYRGWGGYGSAKAALDQLTNILGAEHPDLGVYAFDPGDMRTEMHQQAFPGEDISDRPVPDAVTPALLHLIDARPASGRYQASKLGVIA